MTKILPVNLRKLAKIPSEDLLIGFNFKQKFQQNSFQVNREKFSIYISVIFIPSFREYDYDYYPWPEEQEISEHDHDYYENWDDNFDYDFTTTVGPETTLNPDYENYEDLDYPADEFADKA